MAAPPLHVPRSAPTGRVEEKVLLSILCILQVECSQFCCAKVAVSFFPLALPTDILPIFYQFLQNDREGCCAVGAAQIRSYVFQATDDHL